MRVFIGIFVPDDLKEKILDLQNQIKNLPLEVKMVEAENLHITLSFLGEISEEKIMLIKDKLDQITKKHKKFEANINGIKLIPNQNYIRVIALDVISNELNRISHEIKEIIGGDVKPPHLTLCRVKNISDKSNTVRQLLKLGLKEVIEIKSICIIKSVIKKTGPEYSSLYESNLI
ncbi:MAG: RNA 2',3'-cyclic phosphodiesterase [Candidatus Aenigmatarchaeota archaeon]